MPLTRSGPARRPTLYGYTLPASPARHDVSTPCHVATAPGVRELHASGAGTVARARLVTPPMPNTAPHTAIMRVVVARQGGMPPAGLGAGYTPPRPVARKAAFPVLAQTAGRRATVGSPTGLAPGGLGQRAGSRPARAVLARTVAPTVAATAPQRPSVGRTSSTRPKLGGAYPGALPIVAYTKRTNLPEIPPAPNTQRPVVGAVSRRLVLRGAPQATATFTRFASVPPTPSRPKALVIAAAVGPNTSPLRQPPRAIGRSCRYDTNAAVGERLHNLVMARAARGVLAGRLAAPVATRSPFANLTIPRPFVARPRTLPPPALPPAGRLTRTWTAPLPVPRRPQPYLVPGSHAAVLKGTARARLVRPASPALQLPSRVVVVPSPPRPRPLPPAAALRHRLSTVIARPLVNVLRLPLPPRPPRIVALRTPAWTAPPRFARPLPASAPIGLARLPRPRPGAIVLPPARPGPTPLPRARVGQPTRPLPLPPGAKLARLAASALILPPKVRVATVSPARPLRVPTPRATLTGTPLPSAVSHVRPPQTWVIRLPLLVPPLPRPGVLVRTPWIAFPLPPDLPAAVILWLQNTAAVTAAFGHTATTPKLWSESVPNKYPGTQVATALPLLAYVEVGEHDFGWESADEFGVTHGFPLGQFQVNVWAASKKQARDLGRLVAGALNDAPLAFADGVLMEFRLDNTVCVPSPEIGPGGIPNDYQFTLTFLYRVMRTLV